MFMQLTCIILSTRMQSKTSELLKALLTLHVPMLVILDARGVGNSFHKKKSLKNIFLVHFIQCTRCNAQFVPPRFKQKVIFFETKPYSTEKLTCFSRISQVAGIASKNMSWIFAEMEMLFSCLGVAFFSFLQLSIFARPPRW